MNHKAAVITTALLLSFSLSSAGIFTTKEAIFTRSIGEPYYDSVSFTGYNPSVQFVLKIQNGPQGYSRISSADVWVNDAQIFSEKDFNQQVEWLEKSITVKKNNVLKVYLSTVPILVE